MIVMCFNEKYPYPDQAKALINSVKINSPTTPITTYLVNYVSDPFPGTFYKGVSLENIKAITAYSLRAMYEVLLTTKSPVLWLDTDVLVRGNLSPFLVDIKPNTMKVLKRNTAEEGSIFNTGVVAVGYSSATLSMLYTASQAALQNPQWFADQLYLYRAYEAHKEQIELINLLYHKKWHDLGGTENAFADDSIIWHCKSNHAHESPFVDEYNYYRGI